MSTPNISIKKGNPTQVAIIAVVALIGIGAWIFQLIQGMQVTGLSQQVVWGLYIAAFFTAVGVGAGLLTLIGISEFMPLIPVSERSRNLSLALTSFVLGALFIAMDVGNPLQIWRLIVGFRFSTMMTWDFWLLLVAGVVTLVYLLSVKDAKPQKGWGVIGIIAAVAVVTIEGWMLSTVVARPMWGSGFTVLTFLLGALIAGLSLALIVNAANETLQTWLKFSLWLSLAFVLIEVFTGLVGKSAEFSLVMIGFPAIFFWLQVILGLLLPVTLLTRKSNLWLVSLLAILGGIAEKVWILAAGEAKPWLALPEGLYFPSWVELVAVIGMVALGVLIYYGINKVLKIQ